MPGTAPENRPLLERRTVVKAAAWGVPVVAAVVATPLAAASLAVRQCDPSANGATSTVVQGSWSTVGGALKQDENQTGWYGVNGFRSWDNNGSPDDEAVVLATYTFTAAANTVYSISLDVQVGAGTSPLGVARQNVHVDVLTGGTERKLVWVHTSDGVPYPDDVDGYVTQYTWDTTPVTYSTNVTSFDGGTVTVRYLFILEPTADVNDDIWINDLTVTQVGCAV